MKKNILKALNIIITIICFGSYAILLVGLLVNVQIYSFMRALLIPAVGFLICTLIRTKINAKRPYELGLGANLFDKKTTGKSFPSRHVFSIFVIATTMCSFIPIPGILLLILGSVMAVIRVMAGVHFIKDVLAGALLGIGIGCINFILVLSGVVG